MQRTVHFVRLFPYILHHVNFAALRPIYCRNIVAHHPERRPHSLPRWNFNARFESSIRLRKKPQRFQPRGGVLPRDPIRSCVRFFLRRNDKASALDLGVCSAIRVAFQFVIPPTAATEVISPFACIRRRAIGTVEFVAPGKCPTAGRGNRRWDHDAATAATERKNRKGQNEKNREET